MLESHKVPGQCVPLDFCGCKSHWHREGLIARVSVARVLDIMVGGRGLQMLGYEKHTSPLPFSSVWMLLKKSP